MTAPSRFAIVSGMAAAFTGPCPCRNKRNALVAILITVLMPMVRCALRAGRACACEGERALLWKKGWGGCVQRRRSWILCQSRACGGSARCARGSESSCATP